MADRKTTEPGRAEWVWLSVVWLAWIPLLAGMCVGSNVLFGSAAIVIAVGAVGVMVCVHRRVFGTGGLQRREGER